jgi:hypothetical protein
MADRAGNPHIQRVESKFGISAAENAELRRQNAEVRPYCLSHGQDGQTRTSIERRDLSRGQPSLCSSVSVRLVRGYQFLFYLHKARRDEMARRSDHEASPAGLFLAMLFEPRTGRTDTDINRTTRSLPRAAFALLVRVCPSCSWLPILFLPSQGEAR